MSNSIREQLVGYLLNAVEPDEHRQIEEHLASDEALRHDLNVLQWGLVPLKADADHHEPPPGLAVRCCEHVYSRTEVIPVALSPAGMTGAALEKRRWSWLDLSVAGAIAVAVVVLLVPAIYQSNAHARLLACQNNLKDIGFATASYSDRNGGLLPAADRGEPVGKWASMLGNRGLLPQIDRSVVCPSSPLADDRKFHVPSDDELGALEKSMTPAEFAAVLDRLSGSYGETLGYTDGQVYRRPRNSHQSDHVVFADLPGEHAENSPNHGRRGQNALFGDGRVQHLSTAIAPGGDDIFRNHNGLTEPSDEENDTVIVNAGYRP